LNKEAVILSAVRMPVGKYGGMLSIYKDYEMGAMVIAEAVKRSGINPKEIEDVYFGNLLGLPGNVAKVAAMQAGLPENVPAVSVDRQCASGLETICIAAAMIKSGMGEVYVAGGTESMTNKPYYLEKAKKMYSPKSPQFLEAMLAPPELGDPLMGETAENVLHQYKISRQEMDEFALRSHTLALKAIEDGTFEEQILPVTIRNGKEQKTTIIDECPRKETSLEKLSKLSALFKINGSVTAGNSCPMNDGAAAVVLMDREKAEKERYSYMGVVKNFAAIGLDHNVMGLGPIYAVKKLLKKSQLTIEDIGIFELNEAFASQSIACVRELNLDINKVNINGGAIALGHPLGATGTILTTKLLYAMKQRNVRYGIVTMCIGGGQGAALLIENTKGSL
jgi:acetyl-CoA C-acetyltransferase